MSVRTLTWWFSLLLPVIGASQPLLVTEIMADPTPSRGLPKTEYLEIYNAGPDPIPLSDIAVASGGRATSAGASGQLEPDAYLLLVPRDSLPSWSSLGVNVSGISFPALTNSGDEVTLLLRGDTAVHLRYTDNWYRSATRDDGGYSLEYNGLGPPDCPGSWGASDGPNGGTPGLRNTLADVVLDTRPPGVSLSDVRSGGFDLMFDETISSVPEVWVNGLAVQPEGISPARLSFDFLLDNGFVYSVVIAPNYSDCSGNMATDTVRLSLLLPVPLEKGDVLINEILFDPVAGGSDYVEILNNTSSTVQLEGIRLQNRMSGSESTLQLRQYLEAGQLLVFTEDTAGLRLRFPEARVDYLVQTDLPGLPNAAGNLTLTTADGMVLDALDYREDFHDPLLNPTEGVSLERLDPDAPTQDRDNWYSAATEVGYGTPTLVNSQSRSRAQASVTKFTLPEPTFSPGRMDLPDELGIQYRTDRPGLQARITVFDVEGRPVRKLQEVSLLGSSGTTYWDGKDDGGRRLPLGPYVILIEVIAPDGSRDRYKLVGTLAG